ncbi:MAG: FkbM family methyltransferase [Ilumatobacteraceae bacterium]
MASTPREKLGIIRYVALCYVARALPFNTYGWSTAVLLNGTRCKVGLRSSEIYIFEEIYRYGIYDRLPAYVPSSGWNVVDLGANVGLFTLHAASKGARVFSFEPNPECFERLRSNVRLNDATSSVALFNEAVSDEAGRGQLTVERGGSTGGTVQRGGEGGIRMTTLDHALAASPVEKIDLLKMDIEGAEVDALRGAEASLAKTERIIAEYHSRDLLDECTRILEGHGFAIDLSFVYFPEDPSIPGGGEEVGMFYASRGQAGSVLT